MVTHRAGLVPHTLSFSLFPTLYEAETGLTSSDNLNNGILLLIEAAALEFSALLHNLYTLFYPSMHDKYHLSKPILCKKYPLYIYLQMSVFFIMMTGMLSTAY